MDASILPTLASVSLLSILRRFDSALSLRKLCKDERADQTASTFGSQWRTTNEMVLRCSEKLNYFGHVTTSHNNVERGYQTVSRC